MGNNPSGTILGKPPRQHYLVHWIGNSIHLTPCQENHVVAMPLYLYTDSAISSRGTGGAFQLEAKGTSPKTTSGGHERSLRFFGGSCLFVKLLLKGCEGETYDRTTLKAEFYEDSAKVCLRA